MYGYLSLDIICSSKLTVFLELRSRKTVRFSEQIMSADKYPGIFSRQMETIVYTKAEFNNCFIIHSKYFQSSKNISLSLHNFLIGFCRVHGKITRYLKTINKKQEKSDQQNFIQGSDKFAVRSKIRMNFLRVRSPRNTI